MILASLEICIVLSVSENYLTLITRFALHMAGTPRHQDCGLTESLKAQTSLTQYKTRQNSIEPTLSAHHGAYQCVYVDNNF